MPSYVEAESCARVCIVGESTDWTVNGPSIVGAIGLRTNVKVESLPSIGDNHVIFVDSRSPLPTQLLKTWNEIHWWQDPYLKYVESAIELAKQPGTDPRSFTVSLESQIPAKAGISSSAAVTLATVAATSAFFGQELSKADICEMAYRVEHDKLETGAGKMDFYGCGQGGLIYLNCATQPVQIEPFQFPNNLGLLVVDTLTPHGTKEFISSKRTRFEQGETGMVHYVDMAVQYVEQMRQLLPQFNDNREEIGSIMTNVHKLLRDSVQCSTELLDLCVDTALQHGALGAKLTGSGMGGCMFALVDQEHAEEISLALQTLPVHVYSTTIVEDGVSIREKKV